MVLLQHAAIKTAVKRAFLYWMSRRAACICYLHRGPMRKTFWVTFRGSNVYESDKNTVPEFHETYPTIYLFHFHSQISRNRWLKRKVTVYSYNEMLEILTLQSSIISFETYNFMNIMNDVNRILGYVRKLAQCIIEHCLNSSS